MVNQKCSEGMEAIGTYKNHISTENKTNELFVF